VGVGDEGNVEEMPGQASKGDALGMTRIIVIPSDRRERLGISS
jgi:hypothetical protein